MRSVVLFSSDISDPHRPTPLQGDDKGLMGKDALPKENAD